MVLYFYLYCTQNMHIIGIYLFIQLKKLSDVSHIIGTYL